MMLTMNTTNHSIASLMPSFIWPALCLVGGLMMLSACQQTNQTQGRITLDQAIFTVGADDTKQLSITQRVPLTPAMFDALDSGINLYFDYQIHACGVAPLRRELMIAGRIIDGGYAVRWAGQTRIFATQADLLAGLDRLSMALPSTVSADCQGAVQVMLALTRLPTPMRFPAFFYPNDWRLSSPLVSWHK